MAHQVILLSIGLENEVEWAEVFTACTKTGVRRKATNWIHKNLFFNDYAEIKKDTTPLHKEYWTVV